MTTTPHPEPAPFDLLAEMLAQQDLLQQKSYGNSPTDLLPDQPAEAVKFITWNVLALTDELHELLAETGWKPWSSSEHVNLTAARSELIDAFHFFMNLALVLGMDAETIYSGYMRKREKNAKRQADGYDGISGKCPGCKRALDDEGVDCQEVDSPEDDVEVRAFYCAESMNIIFLEAGNA